MTAGVTVGPHAVIGPDVTLGPGTTIGAHAVLEGRVTIGAGCTIGHGAVIGSPPQDRGYDGEPTSVVIGDRTVLREYATVHRGTAATGATIIGADCYLMAYVHVAHDARVGDGCTLANAVQLAGHVRLGRQVTIGGLTPVHQFVRIGDYAVIGGGSRVPQDVPPYAKAVGDPLRLFGVNTVALARIAMPAADRRALQRAYRLVFNSRRSRAEALAELADDSSPPVRAVLAFLSDSTRGIVTR